MSPAQEQAARGEGHRVDRRSDVFSLGVVLYELLTGRKPFLADSVVEVMEQITTTDPRPPRQTDQAIPMELERICQKALSKRASERYSTAQAMAEELRLFLQSTTSETGRPAVSTGDMGSPSGSTLEAIPLPITSRPSGSHVRPIKIVPKGLRSFDAQDADFFLELLPGGLGGQGRRLPGVIRILEGKN